MTDEPSVQTYETEVEFRVAAKAAWEEYLLGLDDGEEPAYNMKFFGVVKKDGGYAVMTATFNPETN